MKERRMTDSENESKIKVNASFRVMGETLQPERVSELLEISPAYSHRKGDANVSPSGRHFSERSGGIWILESEADSGAGVEAHILSILEQLKGKRDSLQHLKQEGLRMDIFVGVFGLDEPLGFSIEEETVSEIAFLGLRIDFDIYTA